MRNLLTLMLIVLVSCASEPPVTVIQVPADTPVVTLKVYFKTGSIHDPDGKPGLNDLTAAMLNAGSNASLTYGQIMETIYPMAASVSYSSGKEVTVFTGKVLKQHLEPFLPVFVNMITQPLFNEAEFQSVRASQIDYIENQLKSGNDEELGKLALEYQLYEGHHYQLPPAGKASLVKRILLEDVKSHYRQWYTISNVFLGISGDYPPESLDKFRELIQALPEGHATTLPLPAPLVSPGTEGLIIEKPSAATAISFGYPLSLTPANDDYYKLLVANAWLGDHRTFNGHLMTELRVKRGLTYGAYSYLNFWTEDPSNSPYMAPHYPRTHQFFSVWVRPVAHENTGFTVKLAYQELIERIKLGMPPQVFTLYRDYIKSTSKLWAQTAEQRLAFAMDDHYLGIKNRFASIDSILSVLTVDEVNLAMQNHLTSNTLVLGLVTRDGDSLKSVLMSGQPTPVVYAEGTVPTNPGTLARDAGVSNYQLADPFFKVMDVREFLE